MFKIIFLLVFIVITLKSQPVDLGERTTEGYSYNLLWGGGRWIAAKDETWTVN